MATEYKMGSIRVERETTNPETRRTERHAPQASLLLWVGKTGRPVSIPLDLAAEPEPNIFTLNEIKVVTGDWS